MRFDNSDFHELDSANRGNDVSDEGGKEGSEREERETDDNKDKKCKQSGRKEGRKGRRERRVGGRASEAEFYSERLDFSLHYNEETPRDLKDELYAGGEVVAARSSADKLWYRARVLDHDSGLTDVTVFFLDTGDVEEVHQMWIHPLLLPFLEGLPIQAFECTLHGVAVPEAGWSEEAFKTVQLHSDGRPLHARVEAM